MVSYVTVSELTGVKATCEQLQRLYSRYRFAVDFCAEKDVLEVACGSGQGLGYLAKVARSVTGGDYDPAIVKLAQEHYEDRVEVLQLDAHALPFKDHSFDVILLYEAIYYLKEPEKFFAEAKRVLRPHGTLIVCTANKSWSGFNPSPYSHHYYSAPELYDLFSRYGFKIQLYGDSPVNAEGPKSKLINLLKMGAVKFRLIPRTMKGNEPLKRIFQGKLYLLPAEIDEGLWMYSPLKSISCDEPNVEYKVLFAVGIGESLCK